MRKIFAIGFLAAIAILGLTTVSAHAATLSPHGVNCAWAPSDPTCPTTQPGTPGGCTPHSFANPGGCTTDTLSFTGRNNGHDWNNRGDWNNQDPCIFHQHKGWQEQNRFQNTEVRGCRCELVKVWHTKTVCHKEVRYFTLEIICRSHHRDPGSCGCQTGGHGPVAPLARQAA